MVGVMVVVTGMEGVTTMAEGVTIMAEDMEIMAVAAVEGATTMVGDMEAMLTVEAMSEVMVAEIVAGTVAEIVAGMMLLVAVMDFLLREVPAVNLVTLAFQEPDLAVLPVTMV